MFEIWRLIGCNLAPKIAAKPLRIPHRDMITTDSLQELVVALSNGTIADSLRRTVQPQYCTIGRADLSTSSKVNDFRVM